MVELSKGRSPFYPGQPVPFEFFVGRSDQIQKIMSRGVGQVSQGKPMAMYVQGEYGIGKSSIASLVQFLAEKDHGLHGIYVSLGGCKNLGDVAESVIESTVNSGAFDPKRSEKIRGWLAKYIGKQELFGFSINLEALKKDAPSFSTALGMLGFLSDVIKNLSETGIKGVFLVLDEINGITADAQFSHFIKTLIDTNALSRNPVPLLLMLCGVEERRREMIRKHQPIDRIFEIVEIEAMSEPESRNFYTKAFNSVNMKVEEAAMKTLVHYSAGFPKIMHLVGDSVYWLDKDGIIDDGDASKGIILAADEVGKKYVEQQVYKALRSSDYHSILLKIAKMGPDKMSFTKSEVEKGLTSSEKGKFNNFLQKMKKLHVIRSGEISGEYIFNLKMVRFYIWLQSLQK